MKFKMNYEFLVIGSLMCILAAMLLVTNNWTLGFAALIIGIFIATLGLIKREGPGGYSEGGA